MGESLEIEQENNHEEAKRETLNLICQIDGEAYASRPDISTYGASINHQVHILL